MEKIMSAPICMLCRKTMRCEKNGVFIGAGVGYVMSGDLFECGDCGGQVVVGLGAPFAYRGETGAGPVIQIDDERPCKVAARKAGKDLADLVWDIGAGMSRVAAGERK